MAMACSVSCMWPTSREMLVICWMKREREMEKSMGVVPRSPHICLVMDTSCGERVRGGGK